MKKRQGRSGRVVFLVLGREKFQRTLCGFALLVAVSLGLLPLNVFAAEEPSSSKQTETAEESTTSSVAVKQLFSAITGTNKEKSSRLATQIRSKVPATLKKQVLFLELWQWIGVGLIALLIYLVKVVAFLIGRACLRRIALRLSFLKSAAQLEEVATPLAYLVLAVLSQFAVELLDLPAALYAGVSLVLGLVRVVAILLIFYRLIDIVAEYLLIRASRTSTRADDLLIPLFQRVGKVGVVILGIVLVADLFHFNVAGIVAGLGLGGLAFALAAKDTVENVFGSVTVLLDQPFAIGDYISVAGMEGTVEHIGLRSTRIRTPLNSLITMPNSTLISTSVENLGAREFRRTRMMLGITYDTPVDKIEQFCEKVRELIRNHPKTRKDYFHVELNEFADSSLNIMLNVYFAVDNMTEELACRSALLTDIMRTAEQMEVEFAFPTRTVHLAQSEV